MSAAARRKTKQGASSNQGWRDYRNDPRPNQRPFCRAMVGAIGTPRAGQIGIEYTSPEKPFWSVPLPEPTTDDFGRQTGDKDRRRHILINSAPLSPIWMSGPRPRHSFTAAER